MKKLKIEDAAWLAGLADGDGCWSFKVREYKMENGKIRYTFGFSLEIGLTDEAIIDKCRRITGVGWKYYKTNNYKGVYIWSVGKRILEWLLPQLKPYCVKGAPMIIEEAMKLTGLPRVPQSGKHGGHLRQAEATKKLLSLFKEWKKFRVRPNVRELK